MEPVNPSEESLYLMKHLDRWTEDAQFVYFLSVANLLKARDLLRSRAGPVRAIVPVLLECVMNSNGLRTVRVICFGSFKLHLDSGELFKKGHKVKLQGQPFELLAVLAERPAEVLTRRELRGGNLAERHCC
jgi:DNA-binding response OmpR family regulator